MRTFSHQESGSGLREGIVSEELQARVGARRRRAGRAAQLAGTHGGAVVALRALARAQKWGGGDGGAQRVEKMALHGLGAPAVEVAAQRRQHKQSIRPELPGGRRRQLAAGGARQQARRRLGQRCP